MCSNNSKENSPTLMTECFLLDLSAELTVQGYEFLNPALLCSKNQSVVFRGTQSIKS